MQLIRLDRLQKLIVVGLFSLLAIAYLAEPVAQLPFKIGKDYNEGWNALHAERIINSEYLYPKFNDLVSNNYPPLSFYFVSTAGRLLGDNIFAGRVLALSSFLIVSFMISLSIKRLGANNFESFVTGLFFISYMSLIQKNYIAMNDPQWLGHAIQMIGLVFFLNSKEKGILFYLSILLMVLSVFVKHNIISLPLSITVWLFIYNRKALVHWITVSVILILLLFFVFLITFGIEFLQGFFINYREWDVTLFANNVESRIGKIIIILAIGGVGTFLLYPSKSIILFAIYSCMSTVWGAYISGVPGVDWNAFFDLIISLTLIIGLLLSRSSILAEKNELLQSRLHICVMLVLFFLLSLSTPNRIHSAKATISGITHKSQLVADDIDFLSSIKGPAMCENLSLCYWAGKAFEVDFFNTGQKIRNGVIKEEQLIRKISGNYYSVIQVNDRTGTSFRLPDNINEEVLRYYDIIRISPSSGVFLVPKIGNTEVAGGF